MISRGVLMNKINCYFVNQKNDEIKLLIEILDKEYSNLSSFYYELLLKINGGYLDNSYYEVKSIKEIYNIFEYLYNNFNGNIKKRKLDETTTDYVIKMLNMQTYKKGFDERLTKRINDYNNSSQGLNNWC